MFTRHPDNWKKFLVHFSYYFKEFTSKSMMVFIMK